MRVSLSRTHTQKSTKFEHQEKNDDEDRHEMDDGICVGDGKEGAKKTTTTTTYSFEF